MSKFYSKSTGGFYSHDVHGKDGIPGDAHEITDEYWQELLTLQGQGKRIVAGTHGGPIAMDPDPGPGLLAQRDNALRDTDWLVCRHRDEVEFSPHQTTLTHEQYKSLQKWRRDLRALNTHPDFPNMVLPECPVILSGAPKSLAVVG